MIRRLAASASSSRTARIDASSARLAGISATVIEAMSGEPFLNHFDHFLRGAAFGPEMDFRAFRRLVRRIDAGEVLDLAAERAPVQALRVATGAFLEGRIDEDLDELAFLHQLARHLPLGAE